MPHLIVEYSANLADVVSIPALLETVHQTAAASGLFEVWAIRSRAVVRELAITGDGNPENGFVLVTVRLKAGRPKAVQEALGKALLDAASDSLAAVFKARSIILNVEVHEIPELSFRRRSEDV
ncbi:5-carboxymethyl-2-hydroxymuconate isomerase [Aliidongia dinghuensis]|uniref:5-carboxymethyl-2-hydroxymuconate isomerase n=1 Tax=Aliidongia dinghuensis TaxID=1867774 RepID=A0A8J3E196_9PROT|nr:5-carboxymethyl-2-hydroxymuconate isomerase [Aliidongia dinghuensis]GGF09880.1 5-carboxymethyl-2-hydroxymuconate isomerase [Aliidongia dinghuensis]